MSTKPVKSKSVLVPFRKAVLHHEVSTLDIPEVTEPLEEPLRRGLRQIGTEIPDLVCLLRLLGVGNERRGEDHRTRSSEERAPGDH